MDRPTLTSATELARANTAHVPNESADYRQARNALLAEEIELRRHIERVAELRRRLPPGGEVTKRYTFEGEQGAVALTDLFAGKQTLAIYSFMYGPRRVRPCPMCTALLSAWDGNAQHVEQWISLAVIARSPIERLIAYKVERGWRNLRIFSDMSGEYTRAYLSATDEDIPGFSIFTRRDGTIRHFWSGEMGMATVDPGQDPRGAPDLVPLWNILDTTPDGRDPKWYPKLSY